jgi:anti-sigma regulatory factor (Ser/Thr protein kinase)
MAATTRAMSSLGPGAERRAVGSGGSSARASTSLDAGNPTPAPVIAGSLTLPGQARNVAEARAFVAKTLGPQHPCCDTAVLLCSELVTNAVVHSTSGLPGGTVTIVVLRLTGAVRVEVIDHGSTASTPVVKGEVLAPDGHGLFLVDQLADSWGYVLDQVGTTVWFRLTG